MVVISPFNLLHRYHNNNNRNVLNKFFKHNFTPHLLLYSSGVLLLGVVFVVSLSPVMPSITFHRLPYRRFFFFHPFNALVLFVDDVATYNDGVGFKLVHSDALSTTPGYLLGSSLI